MKEQDERPDFKPDQKLFWKLFYSTFCLSAFTFGGGYVIISLMKKWFVDEYHWISEDEMLDLVAIAQSAPGPMAVNGAVVIGYKLARMRGVLTAIFGTVLPPFLIISAVSVGYQILRENWVISQMLEGMQAGVAAVIAVVVYEMVVGVVHGKQLFSYLILVGAFAASCIFGIGAAYIILVCGAAGCAYTIWKRSYKK